MTSLITAIKRAKSKLVMFCSVLIFAVSFIVSIALFDSAIQSKLIPLIPFLIAIFLTAIITFTLKSEESCRKTLKKLLDAGNYSAEELDSIIKEISNQLKSEYYDRGYRLSLFITETWFILVSTNGSIIEKNENLVSVRRRLMTSQSRYALVLKFRNRQLVCPCDRICEDLTELIKSNTKGANQ